MACFGLVKKMPLKLGNGFYSIDGGSPGGVIIKHRVHPWVADRFEDGMGNAVHASFLGQFFRVAGVEILKKTTETNDMDQLMGDHI
jgi:hypothetical protein